MNLGWFRGLGLTLDLGSAHLVLSTGRREMLLRLPNRILATPEHEDGRGRSRKRRKPGANRKKEADPTLVAPVRHGRIVDAGAQDPLLEKILRDARIAGPLSWAARRTAGVVTPPVLEDEERWHLRDLLHRHGLAPARLIDLAAALARGCGLDLDGPRGQMVIDIGGGKVFMAAYSLGGVVAWHWADVGTESLDLALADYVERRYQVRLTPAEAERVKIAAGSVYPQERPQRIEASGTQTRSGLGQTVSLEDNEVRDTLADGCEALVMAIQQGFKKVPPETASDIARDGLILAGGGALLRGLPEYLKERTGLGVRLAKDPINVAIRGAQALVNAGWTQEKQRSD